MISSVKLTVIKIFPFKRCYLYENLIFESLSESDTLGNPMASLFDELGMKIKNHVLTNSTFKELI